MDGIVMSKRIYLSELPQGKSGMVAEILVRDGMRRRLQDLGLMPGTCVECVGKSPLGDPKAFLIRGAVVALRSEESERVVVSCHE